MSLPFWFQIQGEREEAVREFGHRVVIANFSSSLVEVHHSVIEIQSQWQSRSSTKHQPPVQISKCRMWLKDRRPAKWHESSRMVRDYEPRSLALTLGLFRVKHVFVHAIVVFELSCSKTTMACTLVGTILVLHRIFLVYCRADTIFSFLEFSS